MSGASGGAGRWVIRLIAIVFVILAFVGLEMMRESVVRMRERKAAAREAAAQAPRPPRRPADEGVHRQRGKGVPREEKQPSATPEDEERQRERQAIPPTAIW